MADLLVIEFATEAKAEDLAEMFSDRFQVGLIAVRSQHRGAGLRRSLGRFCRWEVFADG